MHINLKESQPVQKKGKKKNPSTITKKRFCNTIPYIFAYILTKKQMHFFLILDHFTIFSNIRFFWYIVHPPYGFAHVALVTNTFKRKPNSDTMCHALNHLTLLLPCLDLNQNHKQWISCVKGAPKLSQIEPLHDKSHL